jgi:AraC family carnitine catabolism transcriptional activator
MTHVCFVIFPKFQMLAYVLATEVLRIANKVAGKQVFSWETVTVSGKPVKASNDSLVASEVPSLKKARHAELVLLCAGYDPMDMVDVSLRVFLARANAAAVTLGGLDTGSMILAQLGYLDGYKAVVHYEAVSGFQEYWPEIDIVDQIYCLDKKRLTSAGGTSAADALLVWIEATHSLSLARATSDEMVHGKIRKSNERQKRFAITDPQIQSMRQVMQDNVGLEMTIAQIASKLGTTHKRLLNRCRKSEGCTPRSYFQNMRLERAAWLLCNSQMSMIEIATAVGFGSSSAFSKSFKARFGLSPRHFRIQN